MTHAYLDLGPTPAEETPTQLGHDDYADRARKEANAYIAAIRAVCGPEPEGAGLRAKWENHDFGRYLTVVVNYDPDNAEAVRYAFKCDSDAPTTWEAAGMTSPHATPLDGRKYVGRPTEKGIEVNVVHADGTSEPLDPRFDLRRHSPTGFNTGGLGSGCAQLALAICADALGDASRAQDVYQSYKAAVIARLEGNTFEIKQADVVNCVANIKHGRGGRA